MSNSKLHVLIIGAGVSGLLIAQGLQKCGISYEIFETEPSATAHKGQRNWGMTIHWSKPLLEQLLPTDLWSRLSEAQADPSFDATVAADYSIPFYNLKTGEYLKSQPVPHAIRVSRRKLRELCAQGINVQYGKTIINCKCDTVKNSVTASFSDGSSATGKILIGADGHRSVARNLLLGDNIGSPKPIPGGIQLYGLSITYNDAQKARHIRQLHPINWCGFHPDKPMSFWMAMADVPDPEKPEKWEFQLMPTFAGPYQAMSAAEQLSMLKDVAQDLAEPWKSAIEWIPEGSNVHYSNLMYWQPVPWDNNQGRTTLAGDSAHAMPPHRGQGLNHSIQDALNFVNAMKSVKDGQVTLEAGITTYDAEVVKRGADEVQTSVRSAILVHDYRKLMDAPVMKQGYIRTKLK
ncbi:putative monooxygenase [Microthyrium microscopicum]|uniref:Putative monooxygenase n=1 Tax=Microthyrium microscopicum TaxID=703497 RepID=A0A6A6UBX7_9PEZI|nr:putative monooxygenase [Microthyrium microscopicum]